MGVALDRFSNLSDEALLARVRKIVAAEQCVTAHLIALLAELDSRRLYLAQGFSSLFVYCTQGLGLTEHAAYARIEAARISRRFPRVLERLASGELSLTAVCLLAPHLTRENVDRLIVEAKHGSRRDVELIVARLAPRPAVVPSLRRLPSLKPVVEVLAHVSPPPATSTPGAPAVAEATTAAPLPLESYRLQVTISRPTHDKLRLAQGLLRHSVPGGDLADVLERALDALLAHIEKTRLAIVARPRDTATRPTRAGSRHIPAHVRRAVWKRDGGRCVFVGAAGRCGARAFLELHHVTPFSAGGGATVENIELRCRAHNAHEADIYFGSSGWT